MTIELENYLERNDGKPVEFFVSNGTFRVKGICKLLNDFVIITNRRRFKDLGGKATFGRAEIRSASATRKP